MMTPTMMMQDGQCRTVRQFQFTDWPEQGVPNNGEGFIELIGQVHKTKEQFGHEGPIIVHCRSARVLSASYSVDLASITHIKRHNKQ